jgi:hypothetical protein
MEKARPRDALRLVLLLAGLMLLGSGADSLAAATAPARPGRELEGAGWEARRLVAQLLWGKTHAVLHAGVEERAARRGEAATRAGEFHAHGAAGNSEADSDHHDHEAHAGHDEHEDGHVLVIPPAREDFRGILGDLERALKPYLAANGRMYEKDAAQTIPFYRLLTWADPHFIQGWTVGAAFVGEGGKRVDAALEFLHEGERANPASFEIQTELGRLYLVHRRDLARAERHLTAAARLIPRRALSDLEQEARLDAYRWLALLQVEAGRPAAALAVAAAGERFAPGDVTFRHIRERRGRPAR